jgi:GTPase SAR1 family protein
MDLALIGLNNAGKSTLAEVLVSGKFNEDLFTTVCDDILSDLFLRTRLMSQIIHQFIEATAKAVLCLLCLNKPLQSHSSEPFQMN